jgi:hypothetical protein
MEEQKTKSQVEGLSTFLHLEHEVRNAEDLNHIQFHMVNETYKLVPYQQAILIKISDTEKPSIASISGVAQFDKHAPNILWIEKLSAHLNKKHKSAEPLAITESTLDKSLAPGWSEWSPGHALWCPLVDPVSGRKVGALLLLRKMEFKENEVSILGRLNNAYAHAWVSLGRHKKGWRRTFWENIFSKKVMWTVLLIIAIVLCIPVTQTALAPAEVAAKEAIIVSSPQEGVVKKFFVQPNQMVNKGDLLFTLDDTELKNRFEVAKKSLEVVRADYMRAAQKAFSDEDSKAQVLSLKARIEEKQAEMDYTKELLDRIAVHAESAGIAIFEDEDNWLGKPVRMGEKIITLADPQKVDIRMELSIDDAINLDLGADVKLYLNVKPLSPYTGMLTQTSYEASMTAEQILAYTLKAEFDDDEEDVRIGLKGTAKIYGETVSMAYYLFRRPLSALRRMFGI